MARSKYASHASTLSDLKNFLYDTMFPKKSQVFHGIAGAATLWYTERIIQKEAAIC